MGLPLPLAGQPPDDITPLLRSFIRFGSLRASVSTDDAEFHRRLHQAYQDCIEPANGESDVPTVGLDVFARDVARPVVARLTRHAGLPASRSLPGLFPELDLVPASRALGDGWDGCARRSAPSDPVAASRGNLLVVDRGLPWQILVAHYFLDQLMRLQPDWLFFHAASAAIGDRGVFIGGSKGAGKSTLSLALAARGHGFLGDEIAAVNAETRSLAPFRRSVSLRRGPQAAAVSRFFESQAPDRIVLPDGSDRIRIPVSRIFPALPARDVTLSHAFFLEGSAPEPRAVRFDFSVDDIALLGPLHGSVGVDFGRQVVTFLNTFRRVACYRVAVGGTPDGLAELIECIVEGNWDTASRNGPSALEHFAGSRSG